MTSSEIHAKCVFEIREGFALVKMKILFFSPHAYFSVHALPEGLVAESLLLSGHEIVMVGCDGLLKSHCLAMYNVAMSDSAGKERTCATCRRNRGAILNEFNFPTLMLEGYLSDAERAQVEEAMNGLDPETYLSWEIGGVPVGRFALYEFLLNHKLSSTAIPSELWTEYLANFGNALTVYYAMSRILTEQRPDRVVTYNSLYSVNRIACAVADQLNIPHFTLHAGRHHQKRLQQMTIFKGIGTEVTVNRLPTVDLYRSTPCNSEQVEMVTAHVRELLRATSPWVYSIQSNKCSSEELLARFGVKQGQKVLLALMRSGDERMAATYAGITHYEGNPLFEDQYDWLQWLVAFARQHPEYVIVVRVHPREFPNKREKVTSQNANRLLSFLDGLDTTTNLHINLPQDELSLHDLLKITDVLLNSTSTAALEGSLFGIPVVGAKEEVFAFDLALQVEPVSVSDYVEKIEKAVEDGWSFARVITAYRWLNYVNTETSIDISDGYKPTTPPSRRSVRAFQRLGREVRRLLGLKGYFPEVRTRSRPLANATKLTYAIVNAEDSHIGAFPMTVPGDAAAEREQVAQAYRLIMDSICDPKDSLFRAKFEAVVSGRDGA